MSKKKEKIAINNPDELNKHLQYTSITTWIVLGAVILSLAGLFTWSFVYKIQEKITGKASISSGAVTLTIEESQKPRLAVGQKVYIADKVGEIKSIDDGNPVVSLFDLEDGSNYTYTIVVKEMRPIDFLIN